MLVLREEDHAEDADAARRPGGGILGRRSSTVGLAWVKYGPAAGSRLTPDFISSILGSLDGRSALSPLCRNYGGAEHCCAGSESAVDVFSRDDIRQLVWNRRSTGCSGYPFGGGYGEEGSGLLIGAWVNVHEGVQTSIQTTEGALNPTSCYSQLTGHIHALLHYLQCDILPQRLGLAYRPLCSPDRRSRRALLLLLGELRC
ncbi:hypothetical protein OE88DRAFT_1244848 [Heliocybe sulcata]|uniref:Uncharacterized protein n=1 Tax=Heliocybe sulcata TaxID=5364 RepID=A0A5C3NBL3_9AGAM|nr:hypothetical protein OE88DRAFT_1244848 [Heliocybe sulcata]